MQSAREWRGLWIFVNLGTARDVRKESTKIASLGPSSVHSGVALDVGCSCHRTCKSLRT